MGEGESHSTPFFAPLPSLKAPLGASPFQVVTTSDSQVTALIEAIISASGLSIHEVARRLGVKRESLRQYIVGRRVNPSLKWLTLLGEVCGARLVVELPARSR